MTIYRTAMVLGVFTLLLSPQRVFAEPSVLDSCVAAAQTEFPGDVVKMEKKIEGGRAVYEFEVKGTKETREFECDGLSAKITERETEVASPDDPKFKSQAKVSLDEARAIALKKYPGTLVETEFELESDGRASYEFDIKTSQGGEIKLEIDAATGQIVEDDQKELYQIGQE